MIPACRSYELTRKDRLYQNIQKMQHSKVHIHDHMLSTCKYIYIYITIWKGGKRTSMY